MRTKSHWKTENYYSNHDFDREDHERLANVLHGVKGKFSTPLPEARCSSVFKQKRTKHSQKPIEFYQIIEAMCPNAQYLEVFSRNKRDNWQAWGNENL